MLHRDALFPGGHGDGGKIGGLGHQGSDLFHHFVHPLHFVLDGGVDGPCFVHAQPVIAHKLIHIQPVACGGRDASGAGVGLLQIAHGGQVRHFVADGGRRIIHIRQSGDGFGTYGLGGADIEIDNASQNLLFSVCQFHFHALLSDEVLLALVLPEC